MPSKADGGLLIKAMDSTVVLIGVLTLNSSAWMNGVLKNVEAYAGLFGNYRCLIVDGNSTDATVNKCEVWCAKDSARRTFVQQPKPRKQRGESLVEARTMVLEHFSKHFGRNTYLLLLDGDSVNAGKMNLEGFKTCFERSDWTAVFANQPSCYYDVWALRDEECPQDYQIPVHMRQKTWSDIEPLVKQLQRRRDPSLGFLDVQSAFGGAGLYKTWLLDMARDRYLCWQTHSAVDGMQYMLPVCEHVPFHESMVKRGCKLFVNCAWLISDHL